MDEYCIVKQRAGPLVKVFSTDRACFLRKNGECIRSRCGPAMSRTTVDKLELRLALFEYDGVFHSLTFAPENLPESRKEVQQIWNTYLKRLKRWGSGKPFDYVYRIEGLHDSLHIHVFLRNSEYPAVLVRRLWDWGEAYDVPYAAVRAKAKTELRGYAAGYVTNALEGGHVQTPGRYVPAMGKKLKANRVKGKYMYRKTAAELPQIAERGAQEIEKKAMAYLEGNG